MQSSAGPEWLPPGVVDALTPRVLVPLALVILLIVLALSHWLRNTPQHPLEFALERDERPLWRGAPRQGMKLEAKDVGGIVFALIWNGFLFVWASFILSQTIAPLGFRVGMAAFSLPFVAIGVYMLPGAFYIDARRRKRTGYALTDRRAIIGVGDKMESFGPDALRGASLVEHADGTGTIKLIADPAIEPPATSYERRRAAKAAQNAPKFERIADAARVFSMMQEIARGATTGGAGGRYLIYTASSDAATSA